ncbi:MAG: DNA repair exonuclease [Cenarchaeum symbiont of Oopsacas minuta]|nr:DNA repair exonuclease [Cenarchaeum symbiont of Oopsacas minuta]
MKVIHFSDTHLGYREYHAYDPKQSINQREIDTYQVFNEVIDYIIKIKPDLVIHAGDLFDSQRPGNRAISTAMFGLSKISKAQIPIVIVAGNHSTPRDRSEPSILNILKYLPNVYPIYNGKYEKISIGECMIHGIPHMYSSEDLQNALKNLLPDKSYKYNIFVTHAAIRGIDNIASKEFKEQIIPKSFLSKTFDYIALGHYHKFIKIQENAYYSGSPEKFSFNEESYENGFLEIELNEFALKHKSTHNRLMETITIECENLESKNIINVLKEKTNDIENKIIKIQFNKIKKHVWFELDQHAMKNIMSNTLHYEYDPIIIDKNDDKIEMVTTIGDIKNEYEAYIKKQDMQERDKKNMLTLGKKYLDEANVSHHEN